MDEPQPFGALPPPLGEFAIMGHDQFGKPHLWRADGFWNEYGFEPHPMDIMQNQPQQTAAAATNIIPVDFQTTETNPKD